MRGWLRPLLLASCAAVLLHACSLTGIAISLASTASALQKRSDPLFTRSIAQQEGPQPAKAQTPAPSASKTSPSSPPAQAVQAEPPSTDPTVVLASSTQTVTLAEGLPTVAVPTAIQTAAQQAAQVAAAAIAQASSPTVASVTQSTPSATTGASSIAGWTWPPDTRLNYKLGGNFRGELHGTAQVQWSKYKSTDNKAEDYQVRIGLKVATIGVTMTSQGSIWPDKLVPQVYEEQFGPAPRSMRVLSPTELRLSDGKSLAVPPTAQGKLQDAASQFVDLTYRFSTGQATLEAGNTVTVWLARPGGLDEWTYDISPAETLYLPKLGAVQAFHLTPRPITNPRGTIAMEMWYAPSLQYLPVRIKIFQGKDITIDLLVESIEQGKS